MDFEFAIWQMLYLFYKPQNVYRNFQYRKVGIKRYSDCTFYIGPGVLKNYFSGNQSSVRQG